MAGAKDAREHWAKRSKKRVFSPACLKVTRPSFFFGGGGGVPFSFEAPWYPPLYFFRKSNT